jgi:hypothetical protein
VREDGAIALLEENAGAVGARSRSRHVVAAAAAALGGAANRDPGMYGLKREWPGSATREEVMRKLFAFLGVLTLAAMVALPDGAARQGDDSEGERDSGQGQNQNRRHGDAGGRCGKARGHRESGYEVIFDGSRLVFNTDSAAISRPRRSRAGPTCRRPT